MLRAICHFESVSGLMQEISAHALDLGAPLAMIGGFVRGQAKKRIDAGGPGWAPLAASTLKRKLTVPQLRLFQKLGKRQVSLLDTLRGDERKLGRALQSAMDTGRTDKAREKAKSRAEVIGESMAAMADVGARAGVKSLDDLIDLAHRELARQKLHGAALRYAAGMPLAPGESIKTVHWVDKKTGKACTSKVIEDPSKERRAARRMGQKRYSASDASTVMLGGFRNAIKIGVAIGRVVVFVRGYAAKSNNGGAVVGNGARLPERRFLDIDAATEQTAGQILARHLLMGT